MPSCPNCGTDVAEDARFCPRCGVLQRESQGGPQLSLPGTRPREPWDVCEIGWWRGYVKSEFFATAIGADGSEFEVARSPQFRWSKQEPPPRDHKGALAAHSALVDSLAEAGWEPLGEGIPWFATRFRRRAVSLRLLHGDQAFEARAEEDTGES